MKDATITIEESFSGLEVMDRGLVVVGSSHKVNKNASEDVVGACELMEWTLTPMILWE